MDDPFFNGPSDPINGFIFNHNTILPNSDEYPNLPNGFNLENNSLNFNHNTILPNSDQYPSLTNGFEFENSSLDFNHKTILPNSDQYPSLTNGSKFENNSLDFNSMMDLPFLPSDLDSMNSAPSSGHSPERGSSSYSSSDDSEDPVLKYISQMLMEEDMETKPCMLRDSLALHAAEKSFYEVLGEKYPPNSPNQHPLYQIIDSPDDSFDHTLHFLPHSTFESSGTSKNSSFNSSSNSFISNNNVNGGSGFQVPNFFIDNESIIQFRRGVEEASKFLPSNTNLLIDLESYKSALNKKEVASEREKSNSPDGSRGRKRGDVELEDLRSNKQSAVYVEEEDELADMFDKILLCSEGQEEEESNSCTLNETLLQQYKKGNNKEEEKMVDLRSLLIVCAQSVSADDRRTANELLKKIRQHSSPSGDGSQRLAHCFANGLEARLNGTGTQLYTALATKKSSAADMLKAYQIYLHACPFMKISHYYANQMIYNEAEKAKTKTLHIIDFGICYGFQWPILIQFLSSRPGGPPKLRITGIELPQPGFRPTAGVEETGRRLAKYCVRFNVPFEYNAIAQKWETIKTEDLKIDSNNEVVAVNCFYRFHNLLDETVVAKNSPRNSVMNLIKEMNPDIFVHAVVNGSYNAPFFVTRFREALFHFSSFFDMFDANVGREDEERLLFEKEFYGREAINVIACEGSERVERPETYKQWRVRSLRAGFKQLPLEQEHLKKYRDKIKKWCHKDFVIDENGGWMLLGWKGRIVYAVSCWVPE